MNSALETLRRRRERSLYRIVALFKEMRERKVGLQLLNPRRYGARVGCLVTIAFCGILTACPVAWLWQGYTWREWKEPSYVTRLQINAELRGCIFDESDLPRAVWIKDRPFAFPFYSDWLPMGMLGGLKTVFSPRESRGGYANVLHEIEFYDRSRKAETAYRRRRLGFESRWYGPWQPIDLSGVHLFADESRVMCTDFVPDRGPGRGGRTCKSKARHGRLVSVISIPVGPDHMTEKEMIRVLQANDKKISQCATDIASKEWERE